LGRSTVGAGWDGVDGGCCDDDCWDDDAWDDDA
jgi:hypothetical protein